MRINQVVKTAGYQPTVSPSKRKISHNYEKINDRGICISSYCNCAESKRTN